MFMEMVGGNGMDFNLNDDQTSMKRARVNALKGNAAKRSSSRCWCMNYSGSSNQVHELWWKFGVYGGISLGNNLVCS
jgi:hypothetical protein